MSHNSVMLYSGGMDSLIMEYIYKPDVLLYIDIGGEYSCKEIENINKKNIVVKKIDLGEYEIKENLMLPARNAFFCLVAANYGDLIYLGATDGDRSTDKDETFLQKMHDLFDHMFQKQHWTDGRKVRIITPFMNKTKTEIVKIYLEAGGSEQELLNSISCYHSNIKQCGECKPCARKWVALKNNNIKSDGIFNADPQLYFTYDIIEKCNKYKYRGKKEDSDIIKALRN